MIVETVRQFVKEQPIVHALLVTSLGLSCLRNEAYDVKRALDAGQQPCENKREKWQWVAGFGMVSCQFKMR